MYGLSERNLGNTRMLSVMEVMSPWITPSLSGISLVRAEKRLLKSTRSTPSSTRNVFIGQQAGQNTRFCEELKPDGYVITPSENNDVLYYGEVLDEPYRYEAQL